MMRHNKEVRQKIIDATKEILSNTKRNDGKLYVVDFKTRKFLKTYKLLGDACVLNVLHGTRSLEGKTIDSGIKANTRTT